MGLYRLLFINENAHKKGVLELEDAPVFCCILLLLLFYFELKTHSPLPVAIV
jgi:hypothetical protein